MYKLFSLSSSLIRTIIIVIAIVFAGSFNASYAQTISSLKEGFQNPPASAKPGVYWYFMDGNMTKTSITADLESMQKAGIGNVVFLEVNVGVPRGLVDFLSNEWQDLFAHAVKEAERLDIEITLGIGPGWTGSGGPWVKPEQSMQQLVSSTVTVQGGSNNKIILPVPAPKKPFFGEGTLTPELKKEWNDFYEDEAVLAYPTPLQQHTLADADEKALYYRAPFSSQPNVKQYLSSTTDSSNLNGSAIDKNKIIDLTGKLHTDGTLDWVPPAGNWTIMRFGRRNNGAITRPAPIPGLGFECDKFDTVALNAHLDNYIGKLLKKTGNPKDKTSAGGLKRLHMDSWEMGAQNWTSKFREEFIKRRGYDPLPFYPVYAGNIVENVAISERFLWDLRQTAQELVLENHALQVKKYAHRNGMSLSIEPYDMNPTADLELGNIADVPMAEFWSKGYGFNTAFSCIEATSLAHVNGKSLVPAEAFTAQNNEGWKQYPGAMKNQGDWAFATGINRFVFHTFQNQFLPDSLRPGATMGPYGVQWNRNQTWWPMVSSYHQYLSRCQYLLQQGGSVADILYLIPEQAPYVFLPPTSAMKGNDTLPDRKGYNFDGCSPSQLYQASVQDGMIVFSGGGSYRLLVLPAVKTMTPALLQKIMSLVKDGATVVGAPPVQSPSLSGYPACDEKLSTLATLLWGDVKYPQQQTTRIYGKGKVIWGGELNRQINNLYPEYDLTAAILQSMNVEQDFRSDGPVRYTHRMSAGWDVYFVANTADKVINVNTFYRTVKGNPQLWDPLTGEVSNLTHATVEQGVTKVPLQLAAYQSYFIVFTKEHLPVATKSFTSGNKVVTTLSGLWQVSFDPKWGGPKQIQFDKLTDWTLRPEDGIKYYSGIAVYHKTFDLPLLVDNKEGRLLLNLGEVKNIARVKLNGKDLGVVWTAPWQVDITNAALAKGNQLEIEVANLWPNRLIGDERLPDDGIKNDQWPEWLTLGMPRRSKRFTFTTFRHYTATSPLLPSGLKGPVTVLSYTYRTVK
ncbi:glycosyl hydrolase [Ilyomonas limi]|uniref:Glycosyl hydrolase n=1 Tax=Ilyomonas limi TaxID=2575867 RepID=A0A4U3L938_9BACT|nr:glycosyl hydrolase [Ilyomonas limi]TKK71039.1 glycosyl hydrolase [Ilyomonas limi]